MLNSITSIESIKNNKRDTIRNIHESIELVFDDLGSNSKNTKTSYKKTLEDFLIYTFDKDLNTIQWSDLENVTYDMVMVFRNYLKQTRDLSDKRKLRYSPRTINQKMFALSSIFKKLGKINNNIEASIFELKALKFDDNEGSYGSLTEDEVERLLNYCLDLPRSQKPLEKSLFFETAYVTAIRSGALMELTWKGLKKKKDTLQDIEYNIIRLQDKGSNVEVAITDDLYSRLMVMKEVKLKNGESITKLKDERVFPVTRKTLSKCLKEFCEYDGIDVERNIVLHSLKKASIDKVYKETGDINVTARHGHHKGVEMVYKHYQGKNDSLANSPSLTVFNDNKRDLSELQSLSKEELLEVISNCNGLTIDNILRTHREISNKRNV